MNAKLFDQIISIKKTKANFSQTIKENKKFAILFFSFISCVIFITLIPVLFSFFKGINELIVATITVILAVILWVILNNSHINTYYNATILKRRNKLKSLIDRYNITDTNEIEMLDQLVNLWANKNKPEKLNWALYLIFYSVIYTSFINYYVSNLIKDFKLEYLLLLFGFAIIFHFLFVFIKSIVETIIYGKYESKYNYFLWVSEELKMLKLEKTLSDKNRETIKK